MISPVSSVKEQIARIEMLQAKGKYAIAVNRIDKLIKRQNITPEDNRTLILMKSMSLSRLGKPSQALQQMNSVELTNSNDLCVLVDTHLTKAAILYQLGDCIESLNEVNMAEKVLNDYKNQQRNENCPEVLSRYSRILYSRGRIYTIQGDLKQSLMVHQECIKLQEKLNLVTEISRTLRNIGWIYHNMGLFIKAGEYYQKSYKSRLASTNTFEITSILFYLFKLSIDMKDAKNAEKYFSQLKKISIEEDNILIKLFTDVAQGILLKNSFRPRKKINAEEIFEKIVGEDIIYHELTVLAHIYLGELLLYELQDYIEVDEEIMLQLKTLANWLMKTAKRQRSHILLVETYLLNYRMSLLEMNVKKARKYLTQAQITAEEKELKKLSLKISLEHDSLIQHLNNSGSSIKGKMDQLRKIATQMDLIDGLDIEYSKVTEEEPVALLIMAKNGVSLFAKSFNPFLAFQEQLLGGFLTAMAQFSGKIFSRSLDRVKLGEYTLLMKSEEPLLFSYVFKGVTYNAINKLDSFISKVKKVELVWHSLTDNGIEEPQSILDGIAREFVEIIIYDTFKGTKNYI